MISCTFENGNKTSLRHVVLHAIVEKDGKLLLVKRGKGILDAGRWALPGGFMDRDETAEEGALRELLEETGWQGEIIFLFRIVTNPNRPREDRQNVAFTYIVKPVKEVGTPDKESSEVTWMEIEKLPPLEEFAFDHGETIELYLKYRNNSFTLPLFD